MIPLLYLVVMLFCFREIKHPKATAIQYQYPALRLLVLVHGVLLAVQTVSMSQVHRGEVLESMALAPLLVYFLSLRRGESNKLIFVLLPMCCLVTIFAMTASEAPLLSEKAAQHASSVFLHIFLAMAGYASFGLATLCAMIYLWQSFLLKRHPSALVINYMPNLRDLYMLQWRTLQVGIVLLTLGIGLAKLSPYLWDIPHNWSPKEILSILIWIHFVVLALLRKRLQLHKERLAYSLLIGLVLVLSTFGFMELGQWGTQLEEIPS